MQQIKFFLKILRQTLHMYKVESNDSETFRIKTTNVLKTFV